MKTGINLCVDTVQLKISKYAEEQVQSNKWKYQLRFMGFIGKSVNMRVKGSAKD